MKRNYIFILVLTLVVILDQATKALVSSRMVLGQSIPVIDSFLSLTYIRNSGVAFGIFNTGTGTMKVILLSLSTILALAFLIWLLAGMGKNERLGAAAIGLVAGGALGNLVDRVRMGEVVDFIDAYWKSYHWPAFNVADSSITIGVILLIMKEIFFHSSET